MLGFTQPSIQNHPHYDEVLSRLNSKHATLLDLGCGFGQNLRQLVLDGTPASSITGADLSKGLIDCGHDYFKDRDTLKSEFIVGDVLSSESELSVQAAKRFDIVWAALFFHLWDWDRQLEVSVAASKLLKPVPGSMLIGWQIGATPARLFERPSTGSGTEYRKHMQMYQHDEKSLSNMWEEVGRRTGTQWKVEAKNDFPEEITRLATTFGGQGVGRITFTVERL